MSQKRQSVTESRL